MTMTAPDTIPAERPMMLSLFDDGDSPRVAAAMPLASHMAADQSQPTIHEVKSHVLMLIRQEGELSGRELNDLYRARGERLGWALISFDSPRKRAAELLADGLLECTNEDAKRGTGRIYRLPGSGRAA